jgi:aquaporin Z
VLTLGLVSVILGTASGAQNIGIIGAIGVGAYIALAGLWGSPISGASMNPARTFGPNLVATDFTSYWVYVAGPLVGAVLAVGAAWVLRGAGGGRAGPGHRYAFIACSLSPAARRNSRLPYAVCERQVQLVNIAIVVR